VKRYIAEKNNTTGINVFVTLIYKLENYDNTTRVLIQNLE